VNLSPVVGCDLDEVVADFIEKFMGIAAAKYGVDANERPNTWEWDGVTIPEGHTKKEVVNGVWAEISKTVDFWETLRVVPSVDRQLFNRLNEKAKMYYPTARATVQGKDEGVQSATWLRREFLIPYPTVFVSGEKGPLAAALHYDYFIDDRPVNCLTVKKARPECKVFLCEAAHNGGIVIPEIPRIKNVNEFAALILKGE
jgi:5'(3')-deoxyribonucleotidase